MSEQKRLPVWLKIVTGALGLANLAFGLVGYFNPAPLFENSLAGIDIAGLGAKYAGYAFASRNLAIGVALMIVAVVGEAESIFIVALIRAMIEFQTIVIGIVTRHAGAGTAVPAAFLALEIFIVASSRKYFR